MFLNSASYCIYCHLRLVLVTNWVTWPLYLPCDYWWTHWIGQVQGKNPLSSLARPPASWQLPLWQNNKLDSSIQCLICFHLGTVQANEGKLHSLERCLRTLPMPDRFVDRVNAFEMTAVRHSNICTYTQLRLVGLMVF